METMTILAEKKLFIIKQNVVNSGNNSIFDLKLSITLLISESERVAEVNGYRIYVY